MRAIEIVRSKKDKRSKYLYPHLPGWSVVLVAGEIAGKDQLNAERKSKKIFNYVYESRERLII